MLKVEFHCFFMLKSLKKFDLKHIFKNREQEYSLLYYEFFNLIIRYFIIFKVLNVFKTLLQRFRNYFILNTNFVLFL